VTQEAVLEAYVKSWQLATSIYKPRLADCEARAFLHTAKHYEALCAFDANKWRRTSGDRFDRLMHRLVVGPLVREQTAINKAEKVKLEKQQARNAKMVLDELAKLYPTICAIFDACCAHELNKRGDPFVLNEAAFLQFFATDALLIDTLVTPAKLAEIFETVNVTVASKAAAAAFGSQADLAPVEQEIFM
jgi:hypothetical protein